MTKPIAKKSKSLNLYKLTTELDTLVQIDDPTAEQEFLIKLFATGIKRKAERIGKYIAFLDYQADIFKKEKDRLAARQKALEGKRDRLKEFVKRTMVDTGNMKIEAGTRTFTVFENAGSVQIRDEELVPARFKDIIPESYTIRKNDVAAALKAEEEVPGAELVPGFTLTIR